MNTIKNKIELLAPAKNIECAFTAINAGADAVYIGAADFGARKKAGNSLEAIKKIVEYAHKFCVKIYVTVNTILFDNELEQVENLIWKLYEIGVDAIIFQDFAFFEMELPPIPLHASTQCNNDTPDKIKFLKDCNVERVVLPREFSLSQIKEVTSKIDIETEVFIHGALCVSYSGQCYMSDYIGGRSANRGECAQPCRKKYSVVDEAGQTVIKQGYLLSMKDNNLSNHIKELVDAGVTSLKIEGRLKDKEYVANTVSHYRHIIDKISAELKPSKGEIFTDFKPDINKTFNREYTDFYFDSKRKTFVNPKTPKYAGEKIGKVVAVENYTVKIDSKSELHTADKLAFFDSGNELNGTTIKKIINPNTFEVLNPSNISNGTILYKNFDSEFYKSLYNAQFSRKLPLKICVDNTKIEFCSFGDNRVTYYFNEDYEIAKNLAKAKENIAKQLSKLGDTEFYAQDVFVDTDFNIFLPVSKINEIRRDLILNLQEVSRKNYKNQIRETCFKKTPYPVKELDYSFNISNKKAEKFYNNCECSVKEYSPECNKIKKQITLMKTKHCLRDFAGICLKKIKDNRKLYLVDELGAKYKLSFDCNNCIMKIDAC